MAVEVKEVEVPYYEGYILYPVTQLFMPVLVNYEVFKTKEDAEKYLQIIEPNPIMRKLYFIEKISGPSWKLIYDIGLSREDLEKLNKKKAIYDALFVDGKFNDYLRLKKIIDKATGD